MTFHVALHCSAYDEVASGARNRAVGLAAAFLRAGCRVTVLSPRALRIAPLVEAEHGALLPADRFAEVRTDLDPKRPWIRAMRAAGVVTRATPSDADVVLTDYQPVHESLPTAVTVHDLRHMCAPRWETAMRNAAFRTMFPDVAARARWIVVPTSAVGREVARHVETPARVVVAPNALTAPWRAAPAPSGPGRHLLVVGIAEPRKRFAWLVDAVRRARRHGPVLPLVAVGRASAGSAAVLRGAADLVAEGALRWEGAVEDADLVRLVSESAAVLHPSGYEGFGMTVIEAMACGVPVVAAPQPAVEEVAGDLARWTPADDVGAWIDALLRASESGASRCDGAAARRAHASSFTWDRSAAALLEAWRAS